MHGDEMIDTKNPIVQRFLEWSGNLSMNRLAHVVFVASIRAAMLLEKEAGLQFVRDIMWVDFPNENRVRQALEVAGVELDGEEQDMVIERLGGDMKEMAKVIYAVQRGTPVTLAVEERIVEAVQVVERELARLVASIAEASGDPRARQRAAGRFCRLWRLMELFTEKPKIRRNKLLADAFGVHLGELTKYVEHGLLTYTLPRSKMRLVGESRLQARFPRTVWPDETIAVGSPSVREAFARIIEMPHYCRTHQWAKAIARRNDLDEEERELTRLSQSLESQANSGFKLAELLSKNAKDWAPLYGEGGEAHFADTWRQTYERALTNHRKHEAIQDQRLEVQARQRALQERSASLAQPVWPILAATAGQLVPDAGHGSEAAEAQGVGSSGSFEGERPREGGGEGERGGSLDGREDDEAPGEATDVFERPDDPRDDEGSEPPRPAVETASTMNKELAPRAGLNGCTL